MVEICKAFSATLRDLRCIAKFGVMGLLEIKDSILASPIFKTGMRSKWCEVKLGMFVFFVGSQDSWVEDCSEDGDEKHTLDLERSTKTRKESTKGKHSCCVSGFWITPQHF